MTDKRCGTCASWIALANRSTGWCNCALPPLPESVTCFRAAMALNAGTNCPCWKPKEATDNEGK